MDRKAIPAGNDDIFQNPREGPGCWERMDPPPSSFLDLAVGRVRRRAGGRGLLMALVNPLTLIPWTIGSQKWGLL